MNFSQPTTSNVNDVNEFNSQEQCNQAEEFLVTEKIISEFQIEERNDLLCETNENLQFDIDPQFNENVTEVQTELTNFNNGSLFDQTIEGNFEETTDNAVIETNFPFQKSNNQIQEELDGEFTNDFVGNSQQTKPNVELFTAFKSTEPPKEILQEESQSSNLPFEQQDVNTRLSVDIEQSADILQNQSELQDLQSAFDQSQGQVQIFDSTEALPELSQQESNLFFEQLDQMEGNFPQPDQDSTTCKEDETKVSDNDEMSNQSKEKGFIRDEEPPPSGDETQQSNSIFDDANQESDTVPLQPPPIFELQELMNQYSNSSDSFKNKKLEPPPIFDPMEAFPDLLEEDVNFNTRNVEDKPLEPPPMFEIGEPPEFVQECDTKPIVNIKKSKKLDHREEVTEILQPSPAFDPRGPPPSVTILTDVIQPPKVFDPRLSTQQRMDFVAPNEIVPPTWPSTIIDYNYAAPMHVPMTQTNNFLPSYNIPLPEYPPPLPQDSQSTSIAAPSLSMLNMEDELEEMQEAMEFAKQLMNMTEANGEKQNERKTKSEKKKKEYNKKDERRKKDIEYGPENLQNLSTPIDEQSPLESLEIPEDQMRPKVVFNLNKVKRIHKVDEWQQQLQADDNEERRRKKLPKEKFDVTPDEEEKRRRRTSKDKKEEKPSTSTTIHEKERIHDKERVHDKERIHDKEKIHDKDSGKKSSKKDSTIHQEIWRNKVINQFLKMSKNDINNMINNTSLRRFDMAMKQLVKERKTSLSQEMRITEEEKVRDYDGDQFMTQLSAMLDPGVRESVDITNLPTEFIQHLSAVLHLDPMPGGEDVGEIEMMNSDDFLQQMVMANKKQQQQMQQQQQQEQVMNEDEYTHLPKHSHSPNSTNQSVPVIEKKRSRHHEKKIVHVIRVKEGSNQSDEQGKERK